MLKEAYNRNEHGLKQIGKEYPLIKQKEDYKSVVQEIITNGNSAKVTNENNLNQELKFLNSPDYAILRKEIFGNKKLKSTDIIGVGKNAVILRDPSSNQTVIKIAKPRKQNKVNDEFHNQGSFYIGLELLRDNPKLKKYEKLLNLFTIFEPTKLNEELGVFQIPRIKGHSLKTIAALTYNKIAIGERNLFPNEIDGLSDFEIIETLKKSRLNPIPAEGGKKHKRKMQNNKKYQNMYYTVMTEGLSDQIKNFDELLTSYGLKHGDLHWGNIMLDKEGKYYIIDFGSSEIN